MKLLNSATHHPLTSEYRGPHILNFAGNGEEEEEPEEEPEGEKPEPEEEAPEGEEPEGKAPEGEAEPEGEKDPNEDDDPLETPNPYEEGSAQHDAFENQRAKFKQKLEREREAARKEAESSVVAGKLDQLLTALTGQGASPKPKEGEQPKPKTRPKVELTDGDRAIVTGVLQEIGLDPEQLAQERRRAEVANAIAQIRKENPDAEFDDTALVRYANDSGISRMGGTPYDILDLALLRMQREKKTAGGGSTPAPAPKPVPKKKKEAVNISGSSTKVTPADHDEKPTTPQGYKARILRKITGK